MEHGGVDVIELGVPFSDPSADGPVIQESNMVLRSIQLMCFSSLHPKIAVEQDITYAQVLGQVKAARDKGLKVPILLMGRSPCLIKARMYTQTGCVGYYNPVLAYGEQKAIQDACEAGANGFIMVDLPPEEAIAFRDKCAVAGYATSPAV